MLIASWFSARAPPAPSPVLLQFRLLVRKGRLIPHDLESPVALFTLPPQAVFLLEGPQQGGQRSADAIDEEGLQMTAAVDALSLLCCTDGGQ